MLSIMVKWGCQPDVSLILGHHAPRQRGLGMVHVYGRDVQAAPLREMERCLREIREGHFRPDATRSGMLAGSAGPAVLATQGPVSPEPGREKPVLTVLPQESGSASEQARENQVPDGIPIWLQRHLLVQYVVHLGCWAVDCMGPQLGNRGARSISIGAPRPYIFSPLGAKASSAVAVGRPSIAPTQGPPCVRPSSVPSATGESPSAVP